MCLGFVFDPNDETPEMEEEDDWEPNYNEVCINGVVVEKRSAERSDFLRVLSPSGRYVFLDKDRTSGLIIRKIPKGTLAKQRLTERLVGFIEGSVRFRRTGSYIIQGNRRIPVIIEESIGSRTCSFEVHRWYAPLDAETQKQKPMQKVLPEEYALGDDEHTLADPKPRGGRGYTIIGHGRIPEIDRKPMKRTTSGLGFIDSGKVSRKE